MRSVKNNFLSHWPYELIIGWRYTRAGRSSGRNGFISFISGVSMLGIALGVAALIIVLSVMNGFQKEVRDRMLSVVSHIELYAPMGEGLSDTQALMQQVKQHPAVIGAAPFVAQQALLARGEDMRGAMVRGIDPNTEAQVSDFIFDIPNNTRESLQAGSFNVVLGAEFARSMGVQKGDRITLVAPSGQVTPAGVLPRLKQLTVTGVFDSGHYEYDANMALLNIDDAQLIFRLEAPSGVRLKIKDSQQARRVAAELTMQLGPDVIVRDWTRQNRTWFAAVQVEKRMM
ncbi:MAG: lipoprotein-releasing system transmembrane subunit LolC, partial [Betaproteobacteria bacterium]|nr:lipoprotein-releasing system transmembrane subunit LolC [Betaproteobacteria bacterium]